MYAHVRLLLLFHSTGASCANKKKKKTKNKKKKKTRERSAHVNLHMAPLRPNSLTSCLIP